MRDTYYLEWSAYQAIKAWSIRADNKEAGGVLGGVGRHLYRAIKIPNRSSAPCSSYDWWPSDLREARESLRQDKLRLLVAWHSHPRGTSALPSKADCAYHDGLELIFATSRRQLRLWRLKGTRKRILQNELRVLVCREPQPGPMRWW